MKLKINGQGLLGILAIALMIGVAFAKQWRIPWLYFGASVLFYCGAVIALSVWQEEEKSKQNTLQHELSMSHQRETLMIVEEINESKVVMFTLFRALLGCHLAFAFQAMGIVIDMSDSIVVRMGYFLASLAIGLAIPFLVLTRRDDSPGGPSSTSPGS
jgi:hypothetical protein